MYYFVSFSSKPITFQMSLLLCQELFDCGLCFQGSVQSILDRKSEMDNQKHICEQLGMLSNILNHMELKVSMCFSLLKLFSA